jgi:hypothetical protein
MKSKDKERLYTDLVRICDQIGILPNERPKLITDRKEMHELKLTSPRHYHTGNPNADKRTPGYGQCCYSMRTVFVDALPRHYQRVTYHGRKGNRYHIVKNVNVVVG